jgi:hypothetical protein
MNIDDLIGMAISKAEGVGSRNRMDRLAAMADATRKWNAELESRKEITAMGEEGQNKRSSMQYGLGGSLDRRLTSEEKRVADEISGRENVARIGQEGETGRATMQYGPGGASDRGLRTHEQIAAGTLGLGRDRLTADVQESGMRDLTTRRGQDIGVTKDAAEQAALAPGRAAQAANWEAETALRRTQSSPQYLKDQNFAERQKAAAAVIAANPTNDPMTIMEQFGALPPELMIKREQARRKEKAAEEAKKKASWIPWPFK